MQRRFLPLIFLALALLLVACQSTGPGPQPTPAQSPPPSATGQQSLLVLPDDGQNAFLELIDGAQSTIRCKIYLLTDSRTRQALIDAARRGVDVRVLIEKEPTGGGESNQVSFGILQDGGVQVKWAPGTFRMTHEKSLVIDDRLALIGSFNYTNSSFKRNREYALLTGEPQVVADIAAIFDADWAGTGVILSDDSPLVLSPDNSRARIQALIDGARHTLWLEQSTLLDDEVTVRLVQAARRGVDVRFIGPQRDGGQDRAAPNYEKLRQAGAQVALLADPLVHAKVILVDGQKALLGSINLSFSSLDMNRELGIITSDTGVIQRLQSTIAHDWQTATQTVAAPQGVISWQDAADYAGAEVTVEGEIVRSYDSGKVTYLNFSQDYRNTLTIVIFAGNYERFPQAPAELYLHHRIRVRGKVKMYEGAPEIIVDTPAQIEILDQRSAAPPAVTANAPPSSPPEIVVWQEAEQWVGSEITVTGKIVRTHDTGKVTFANFTENWQGTFSLVVFAADYDKFPQPPAQYLRQRTVQVHGKIKEYQGAPEMVIESPAQVRFVAGAGEATPTAVPTPSHVLAWQEASNYIGQSITVAGKIISTYDTGNITFLDFSTDHSAFVAVIFADDYASFPQPPAELYRGKQVWITGEVTSYKGRPEIIVRSPQQIEVFD